jgi:hypothetical protein
VTIGLQTPHGILATKQKPTYHVYWQTYAHALWVAQNGGDKLPPEARTFRQPVEDSEGWSTWHMWELMAAFGKHIGPGREVPFATNIRLVMPAVQMPGFGSGPIVRG